MNAMKYALVMVIVMAGTIWLYFNAWQVLVFAAIWFLVRMVIDVIDVGYEAPRWVRRMFLLEVDE